MDIIMKNIEIHIGSRLRKLRKEHNMTQAELGKKVGLERNTIASYEAETRQPNAYIAAKIAKSLHVPLDYLCGITDDKYNILIPKDIELDLSRLNSLGIWQLCEYYRFLCGKDEYTKQK